MRRVPVLGQVAQRLGTAAFARMSHGFRGVHPTYAAALAALPPESRVGYDHAEAAALYRNRLDRVYPADYPVLFWLREILPVARVFDVGGHVGVAYYAYPRFVPIAESTEWLVCDVPAVCTAGRELAAERGAPNLRFTSEFAAGDGADVLLASGSLQYLDESLVEVLRRMDRPPRHLLLNLLPLTDGPTFYTEQSIGVSCCPYRIQSRPELVLGLAELGYTQVDEWKNPEKSCEIAYYPECSLSVYDGLYLRRDASRGASA